MEKLQLIYEGKAKKVFETSDPKLVIVSFKDDATAFNGQKKAIIQGKGEINNRLTNYFMKILQEKNIATHFVEELSPTESLVKKVKIVPLETIIRNKAAGSFSKRYGVTQGTLLKQPCLEFSLKNDELNDPLINTSHILALNIASIQEIKQIEEMSFKINEILKETLLEFNVDLIDFKLEFGKTPDGSLILADEISPDTCRFWDKTTNEKLDKDRFRQNLNDPKKGYNEMLNRIFKHN